MSSDPGEFKFQQERWEMEESLIALVIFLRRLGVAKGDWSKMSLRLLANDLHLLKIAKRIHER